MYIAALKYFALCGQYVAYNRVSFCFLLNAHWSFLQSVFFALLQKYRCNVING